MVWSIHLGLPISAGVDKDVFAFASSSHWLATRIPAGLPHLSIRRQTLTDPVLKVLRLEKEIELGEAAFDDEFFVEGDESFVRALLDKSVRDAFVGRAQYTDFTFRLGPSTASVAWKAGWVGGLVSPNSFPTVGRRSS